MLLTRYPRKLAGIDRPPEGSSIGTQVSHQLELSPKHRGTSGFWRYLEVDCGTGVFGNL